MYLIGRRGDSLVWRCLRGLEFGVSALKGSTHMGRFSRSLPCYGGCAEDMVIGLF